MSIKLPTLSKTFFILHFACLTAPLFGQQRWERIYSEYPTEGECAFGIETTADGGFLVLCSRGFDQLSAQMTYLMKVDAEGQVQWKHDVVLGGAVKFCRLTGGNFAIVSRHRSSPASEFEYSYTVCTPTGSIVEQQLIEADGMTSIKASFVTPITGWLSNGGFAVAGKGVLPGPVNSCFIRTYWFDGSPQNVFPIYQINPDSFVVRCIVQGPGNYYYGVGAQQFPAQLDADPVWFKIAYNGQMEPSWVKTYDDPLPAASDVDIFHDIEVANDGNLFVLMARNAHATGTEAELYFQKMDTSGNLIFNKFIAHSISNLDFGALDRSKIHPMADGGAVILFETYMESQGGEDFSLARVNANGDLVWTRHFGREKRFTESPFDLVETADGGFALAGWFNDELFESNDAYIVKTDGDGFVNTNYIHGTVYADLNQDCQKQGSEPPLGGWVLRLERNGTPAFYTTTNAAGHYDLPTDLGQSKVRIVPPANFWTPCQDSAIVSFSTLFDSTIVNFGAKPNYACPVLEVDLAAPFLRRCFPGTYSVTYANRGTTAANNASVRVSLDPDLTFISSPGVNWSFLGNNQFDFSLGNLPIGAVGQFKINFKVDCDSDLGQTHCTEAEISPNETCDPNPNWSGASIEVDGECKTSTVDFKVRNAGTGNISNSIEYVIIEDEIIFRTGQISDLPPGHDTVIQVNANGSTWRIETSQEPFHPSLSTPSVAVEGCGTDSTGSSSTGYVTLFPDDDGDPFVSHDCQQNIGSFDPNDKQGFPQGLHSQHFIEPGTEIEYMIRFQNTGTDTAFSVVVRDTLSQFLDLRSVRPGPSSHPYSFEILGENILKFAFNNILLPDSNVNEAASHGFLKFTIRHVPGIVLGSVIRNTAAIYFDFNEPVITNETWHTVDTGFIEVVSVGLKPEPQTSVPQLDIFPNPCPNRAWVVLREADFQHFTDFKNLSLRASSVSGVQVFKRDFSGNKCLLEKGQLPGGVYLLEVLENERVVASGKLMLK